MKEAKYTKGPWVLIEGDRFEKEMVITTQDRLDGSIVCICEMDVDFSGYMGDEQEANARLISAAPDLLEALQDMLNGWRYIRETHGDLYGVGWDRAEDSAKAAIAKALGSQS